MLTHGTCFNGDTWVRKTPKVVSGVCADGTTWVRLAD